MPTLCPRCGEENISIVQLKSNPEISFRMCSECDTVWENEVEISIPKAQFFEDFLRARGIEPDWEDIRRIREAD